ncbi:MAG: O-antigen ligase family protein [Candidatus Woesebacteria bacterium]|nr:O-antigen ligase family protein [Candidatus Woesebacteria bacterium]
MGINPQSGSSKMKIDSIFIFLFLIIFPFGQIIRIGILQPIDFIVGLAAVYTIVKKLETPQVFKYLGLFIIFALFSWLFSIFIFRQIEVLYGLLYMFRLTAYYFFGIYVWNFAKQNMKLPRPYGRGIFSQASSGAESLRSETLRSDSRAYALGVSRSVIKNKKLLISSLLGVSVISALFGWIQFFMVPDIKALFIYGWDMHLFRLVGTFLDPTFLGLIIVFGLLLSIYRYIDSWSWRNASITIFLLISLAFTYSRASYLAFIAGVLTIIYFKKKYKKLIFLVVGLATVTLLLPTAKNHSIELFRTFSAFARIDNYKTTLQIFSKSPVFGIGYNNMCIAYQKYIGVQDFASHACSGSDSSLLLVLTTMGVTGFIVFVSSITKTVISSKHDSYSIILSSCFVALLIHSLFSNSMFYSWIMGYFAILLSVSLKE